MEERNNNNNNGNTDSIVLAETVDTLKIMAEVMVEQQDRLLEELRGVKRTIEQLRESAGKRRAVEVDGNPFRYDVDQDPTPRSGRSSSLSSSSSDHGSGSDRPRGSTSGNTLANSSEVTLTNYRHIRVTDKGPFCCNHHAYCDSKVSNKDNANRGRHYWTCAKQFGCFFMWCSEYAALQVRTKSAFTNFVDEEFDESFDDDPVIEGPPSPPPSQMRGGRCRRC